MSISVTVNDKKMVKGCLVIDLETNKIQHRQSMDGTVIRSFDSKDVNVYADVSDKDRMSGLFNDLRVVTGLALNAKADCDKKVKDLKKQLGDQRLLYDLLHSEYVALCENYLILKEKVLGKEEEPEAEYNWWEQYT